jgi:hypothetical protein
MDAGGARLRCVIAAARKRGAAKQQPSGKSPKKGGGTDAQTYSCIPPALLWQCVYADRICCPSDHQAASVWPRALLRMLMRMVFVEKLRLDALADADGCGSGRLSMPECVRRHTLTHAHTYTRARRHPETHRAHTYTRAHARTHARTQTHARTYTRARARTHPRTHARARTHHAHTLAARCVHAHLFERFGSFHVAERAACDLVVSLRAYYAEGSLELLSARFVGTFEPVPTRAQAQRARASSHARKQAATRTRAQVPRAGLDLFLFALAER